MSTVTFPSGVRRLLPPIPGEHGAWVMAGAATATPLPLLVARTDAGGELLSRYAAFVGLVVTALLFREATRRRHRTNGGVERRRMTFYVRAEALLLVTLSGVLVLLDGVVWLAGALVIPSVLVERWIHRREWSIRFGAELTGVTAISTIVPVGVSLLGVGHPRELLVLWLLFLGFHAGSVLRVGMMLPATDGSAARRTVQAGLGYHVVLLALTLNAWIAGWLGPAAPALFAVAGLRAAGSGLAPPDHVDLKSLGRAEGTLSLLFVLTAAWLVP